MRYVEFEKTPSGNLRITLTPEGKAELAADEFEYPPFDDFIEWQMCNGWEWICPEEIGALTSCPWILTEEAIRDEKDGTLLTVGRVYWYPAYAVLNPTEQLDRHGYVIFEGAD